MFLRVGYTLVFLQVSQAVENLPANITGLSLLIHQVDTSLVTQDVVSVFEIFPAHVTDVRNVVSVFPARVALQLETVLESLTTLRALERPATPVITTEMIVPGSQSLLLPTFLKAQCPPSLHPPFLRTRLRLVIFFQFFRFDVVNFFCNRFDSSVLGNIRVLVFFLRFLLYYFVGSFISF